MGGEKRCVFLCTREINLPIVRRHELLESVFFLFFKEIRMEKRDRELLEMFLIVGN